MELVVRPRTLAFSTPFSTSAGTLTHREILEVDLVVDDEVVGRGEAAPLEFYDGVSIDQTAEALARYAEVLTRHAGSDGPAILDACAGADPLPQALAAIDIALWDRAGRREGQPIAAMLTDTPAASVVVNATVGAVSPDAVVQACQTARAAGYRCVKLKVGFADDVDRVAAARDVLGPDVALRLDANGCWSQSEAQERLEALAPYALEYVEEPVHGVEALRALRGQTPVHLAMDETTGEAGALMSQATDAATLKLTGCGGISGTLAAATLMRTHGTAVYLSSTLDGPRGIAAGVHVCSALAPLPASGLATLALFTETWPNLTPSGGAIAVPAGPGLGDAVP